RRGGGSRGSRARRPGARSSGGGGPAGPIGWCWGPPRRGGPLGWGGGAGAASVRRAPGGAGTAGVLARGGPGGAPPGAAAGRGGAEASDWIGVPIDVRPLKGQIIRLQAPGPPVVCSVGWGHNYATTKTDGLLWAGTTEEEAGFDEESTPAARDEIGAALLKM